MTPAIRFVALVWVTYHGANVHSDRLGQSDETVMSSRALAERQTGTTVGCWHYYYNPTVSAPKSVASLSTPRTLK